MSLEFYNFKRWGLAPVSVSFETMQLDVINYVKVIYYISNLGEEVDQLKEKLNDPELVNAYVKDNFQNPKINIE